MLRFILQIKPAPMEFKATLLGTIYTFSFINNSSVLISSNNAEYILYKNRQWQCADQITEKLLKSFGNVLDDYLSVQPY